MSLDQHEAPQGTNGAPPKGAAIQSGQRGTSCPRAISKPVLRIATDLRAAR
jgi:hypothetical protein